MGNKPIMISVDPRRETCDRRNRPDSFRFTRVNIGDIGDVFWPLGVEATRRRCEAARETVAMLAALTAVIMLPLLRVFHPPGISLAICPALLHCGARFPVDAVLPFTLAGDLFC